MNQIINTELVLSTRKFLLEELKKPEIDLSTLKVYSVTHPSKKLPNSFIIVRTTGSLRDKGNIDVKGTLEICVYVKNLNQDDDQTQPDLDTLNTLTKKVMSVLDDAIFENTAITSIDPRLVSDPDLRYFYNSIKSETFNVKNNK